MKDGTTEDIELQRTTKEEVLAKLFKIDCFLKKAQARMDGHRKAYEKLLRNNAAAQALLVKSGRKASWTRGSIL